MKNSLILILLIATLISFVSLAGNIMAGNVNRAWISFGILVLCIFILFNGHPHDDHLHQ